MVDVLIVGAGPAGCVAATVLARAGARVRLVDRAIFPRDKLCGDTVNPGTLAALRRIGLAAPIEQLGLRVDGMRLTGGNGAFVDGYYPAGLCGRAMLRRDLDWSLLQSAVKAGASFEEALTVREAILDGPAVAGAVVVGHGSRRTLRARITIAADGRRSSLTFALGLARHPDRPRRWAIGAYYEGVTDLSRLGEMHVRCGRYFGVAEVPGDVANVCLVKAPHARDDGFRAPAALLNRELAHDPLLRDRFARARAVGRPVVLGPLAVDAVDPHVDGLLLAGDASGFVDPMTGDGLRFAVRGGELAADAALEALEHGWRGVHRRLAKARRREFGAKWRFNRAVRALVSSPQAVSVAAASGRIVPGIFRRAIAFAGDC